MSENEIATRYRLKVLRYEPAATYDTFEVGVTVRYDVIVFRVMEGGSGELTVYSPQSDATADHHLANDYLRHSHFTARMGGENYRQSQTST